MKDTWPCHWHKRWILAVTCCGLLDGCTRFRDRREAPTSVKALASASIPVAAPVLASVSAPGRHLATVCLGNADATRHVIFLHGIMPRSGDALEREYLQELRQLAQTTDARIAVPRSDTLCRSGGDKLCWGGDDPTSIAATYQTVVRSAQQCFSLDGSFTLIGFSNGGYHVTRAAMRCLTPQPTRVIALGSAGDLAHAEGRDLKPCPALTLIAGDRDMVRERAERLAAALRQRGLRAEFQSFRGGHVVPYDRLRELLARDAPRAGTKR